MWRWLELLRTKQEGLEKYTILIEEGRSKVRLELLRHLSPFTSERIFGNLPGTGMIVKDKDLIYIRFPVETRIEKEKRFLRRGQVGYSPAKGMIVIAIRDVKLKEPVSYLGRVVEGINVLEKLYTGKLVTLKRGSD